MRFRTEIELPSSWTDIPHTEKILLMGSCFTEHIGRCMQTEKFDCNLNPFGVLFNPFSILQGLERLQEYRPFTEDELISHQGLWHSLMHHGSFSTESAAHTLGLINKRYEEAAAQYAGSRLLILTWGTAYVYRHKEKGQIVANCHKLPAPDFERYRVSEEELTESWCRFLNQWFSTRPDGQVVLSVSPVRHLRDGLHENQLSKAVLLLAADTLQREFQGKVVYFPAYEILLDDLRDYRFYETDLLHPSSAAVEYVYEKFAACCFSETTQIAASRCSELHRMLSHRPLHPDSENWRTFISRIEEKIRELQLQYPYLDFQRETELCHTLSQK